MGIHGIYKEIGPGQRIALSKFAVEHFERVGRPLRLAIDTSIWLFQIQSGKGGSNPALRTFYYRLLRLMALSIHPLFIFDGPNKPPFKRNKRTGPNIASIPEFLAKQLLKQFGFPFLIAPGEAEAECALLQREDVVDAVLSEDVDTLMFGSRMTLRNWSPEQSSTKVPTHVNVYDSEITKNGPSGLDREGMVLVALLSGGDYIPQGVPGCGPKLACEAARAGFGKELCSIKRNDLVALKVWREKLAYELRTNESKFFKTKHSSLNIPEDFPNAEVLGYYTHPAISSKAKVAHIQQSVSWDHPINFTELRSFTADAFDWVRIGGAKKFVRNLAPSVLIKELRLRGQASSEWSDDPTSTAQTEAQLVKSIHGKRNHASTDGITELRISFRPLDLVDIDLSIEEPDDEVDIDHDDPDEDEEAPPRGTYEAPGSPSKPRAPSTYNPDELEKLWISETFAKVGVPLKVQDWEESSRNPRKHLTMKHANKAVAKAVRNTRKKGPAMPANALHRFTRVTKAPQISSQAVLDKPVDDERDSVHTLDLSALPSSAPPAFATSSIIPPRHRIFDIVSSPPPEVAHVPQRSSPEPDLPELPSTVTKRRRRSPLRRAHTDLTPLSSQVHEARPLTPPRSPMIGLLDLASHVPSPSPAQKTKRARQGPSKAPARRTSSQPSTPRHRHAQQTTISLLSSSPVRQTFIEQFFSPSKRVAAATQCQTLDLSHLLGRHQSPSTRPIARKSRSRSRSRGSSAEQTVRAQRSRADVDTVPRAEDTIDLTDSPETVRQIIYTSTSTVSRSAVPSLDPQAANHRSIDLSAVSVQESTLKQRGKQPAITPVTRMTRREMIRIRDSLPGTFAIESVDLSSPSHPATDAAPAATRLAQTKSKGRRYRISQVGVLDLSGAS